MKPSIIFIDECDALFTVRTEKCPGYETSLKNQLLMEMDGLYSAWQKKQIVKIWFHVQKHFVGFCGQRVPILAATNHVKRIDPAFKRRLGKLINIDKPNQVSTVIEIVIIRTMSII